MSIKRFLSLARPHAELAELWAMRSSHFKPLISSQNAFFSPKDEYNRANAHCINSY